MPTNMDPNSNKVPALDLPPPSVAQQGVSGMVDHAPQAMPSIAPVPSFDHAASSTSVLPTAQTISEPTTQPLAAAPAPTDEDSDSLDQEWVSKAKAIVEQTKVDPYLESKELGKVKADYLKIRYNKHIKTAEDHS